LNNKILNHFLNLLRKEVFTMSGYSQNHRGSDKCKCQKSSCNQNRKHNCGCDSCKHRCSCHHQHSNVFYCKEIGRGTIWYPTHHGSRCHETRECCSSHQLKCTCRVREHSHYNHCHRRRNSFFGSNFWF